MAVNLEPCVMCLGGAMTLGVSEIYFALEFPGDGGAGIAANWRRPTTGQVRGVGHFRADQTHASRYGRAG